MFTRSDGILIAIALIVLVIGTATGSGYAMLGMAARLFGTPFAPQS